MVGKGSYCVSNTIQHLEDYCYSVCVVVRIVSAKSNIDVLNWLVTQTSCFKVRRRRTSSGANSQRGKVFITIFECKFLVNGSCIIKWILCALWQDCITLLRLEAFNDSLNSFTCIWFMFWPPMCNFLFYNYTEPWKEYTSSKASLSPSFLLVNIMWDVLLEVQRISMSCM